MIIYPELFLRFFDKTIISFPYGLRNTVFIVCINSNHFSFSKKSSQNHKNSYLVSRVQDEVTGCLCNEPNSMENTQTGYR